MFDCVRSSAILALEGGRGGRASILHLISVTMTTNLGGGRKKEGGRPECVACLPGRAGHFDWIMFVGGKKQCQNCRMKLRRGHNQQAPMTRA